MSTSKFKHFVGVLALAAGTLAASAQAATIIITNGNAPGVGFNDPTPVAPVGGNTGTTLGQQRLIAFQRAADVWGATLTSTVPINILAGFLPLSCTATSAVLGSAGATEIFSDFPGAPIPGTWYPFALANKINGADDLEGGPAGRPNIIARFNANLGKTGCLDGTSFYLGLDNQHGANVDLVTVLLHEFGHGLGFQNFTDGTTGAFESGLPSVWDYFLRDNSTQRRWVDMSDEERAASAVNPRQVVWTGFNVTRNVPSVLQLGTPRLDVFGRGASGSYLVGTASFGPPLDRSPLIGSIESVVDASGAPDLACAPITAKGRDKLKGKIALVDRGGCAFTVKALNVQNAGAKAMIVADNVAGSPPPGMSGTDPAIKIPSVRITQADGQALRTALASRPYLAIGSLVLNTAQYAGADYFGRALMYTPNPYQPGSSVSHWDTVAQPNLLMEPAINADLTQAIKAPGDLTFQLLRDIGW